MKFYYVYVLHNSSKDFIYIGYSEDLKARVASHNNGENKSTKAYRPLELIHYEAYQHIKDAKRRELYLKSNRGRTTLMTMLRDYFEEKKMPANVKVCPVCGGRKVASNDTVTKYGNRFANQPTICLTCKGAGWIDPTNITNQSD